MMISAEIRHLEGIGLVAFRWGVRHSNVLSEVQTRQAAAGRLVGDPDHRSRRCQGQTEGHDEDFAQSHGC